MSERSSQQDAAPQGHGRRWLAGQLLIVWPLLLSVAVVTPAVLLRKTTEVDIQLLLRRVSFRVTAPLQAGLFGSVAARSMTLVSFGSIELGAGRFDQATQPGAAAPADASVASVTLVASDPLARATLDAVTVQEIRIPTGGVIAMDWEGGDEAGAGQALRIQAPSGFSAKFSPDAGQPLAVRACVGCRIDGAALPEALSLGRPARFVPATGQLMSLSGTLPNAAARPSEPQGLGTTLRLELAAGSALAETAIPVPGGVDTSIAEGAKRVSAVVEGSVKYPGFTLPAHALQVGDVLTLGDTPDLRILSLQIDKGIRVRLYGHATHVSIGPPGFATDTVPSWFQRYMSSLFPYLHATIALAAAALAAFQKLRPAPRGTDRA